MRLPQSIARAVNKVARDALGDDWGLYGGLLDHWSEIVGPDYAKQTTPVKVTFPRGKRADEKWAKSRRAGGVLTISLPHGLALEMSHQTDRIKARINGYFGYDAIEKIAYKTFYPNDDRPVADTPRPLSPAEREALKTSTEAVENDELKEALAQLGASILANQKNI